MDIFPSIFPFSILVIYDENHITASVEYVDVVNEEKAVSAEGQYNFRPYNLSDEESWRTVNVAVERDMGIWGNVQIVGGVSDTGRFNYGFAYLVNENGDIFYKFGAPFRTGAQIVDIYTEDYNGDGRIFRHPASRLPVIIGLSVICITSPSCSLQAL